MADQPSSRGVSCRVVPIRCMTRRTGLIQEADQRKRWPDPVWWTRQGLHLRPLPCQQTTGNRCANRRSCRSRPTAGVEVRRPLSVQLAFSSCASIPPLMCASLRLLNACRSLYIVRISPYWLDRVRHGLVQDLHSVSLSNAASPKRCFMLGRVARYAVLGAIGRSRLFST
jgi:hypothetical protein